MTTAASQPPTHDPGSGHRSGADGVTSGIDLAKWLLSDHRRAAWAFATLVVVLVATVATTALLAPHLGDLAGLLGGGLVGGGLGLGGGAAARRYRTGKRRASGRPRVR